MFNPDYARVISWLRSIGFRPLIIGLTPMGDDYGGEWIHWDRKIALSAELGYDLTYLTCSEHYLTPEEEEKLDGYLNPPD